jgi:hypothetical protein
MLLLVRQDTVVHIYHYVVNQQCKLVKYALTYIMNYLHVLTQNGVSSAPTLIHPKIDSASVLV